MVSSQFNLALLPCLFWVNYCLLKNELQTIIIYLYIKLVFVIMLAVKSANEKHDIKMNFDMAHSDTIHLSFVQTWNANIRKGDITCHSYAHVFTWFNNYDNIHKLLSKAQDRIILNVTILVHSLQPSLLLVNEEVLLLRKVEWRGVPNCSPC